MELLISLRLSQKPPFFPLYFLAEKKNNNGIFFAIPKKSAWNRENSIERLILLLESSFYGN